MLDTSGTKTTKEHWDSEWTTAPRPRLPSSLNVTVGDLKRLLSARVSENARFLEIGYAPGKLLAWVGAVRKAKVSGLDYSRVGTEHARTIFKKLGLQGDLRCEDLFRTTFAVGSFDVVFSNGLIEHFEDPADIVRRHVMLLRHGGRAIIAIPNYGGVYGRLLRRFDPDILGIHNLTIMSLDALKNLAPLDLVSDVKVFQYGRLSPWVLNYPKSWPPFLVAGTRYILNGIGLLQPFTIKSLCPLLVLEMVRGDERV